MDEQTTTDTDTDDTEGNSVSGRFVKPVEDDTEGNSFRRVKPAARPAEGDDDVEGHSVGCRF